MKETKAERELREEITKLAEDYKALDELVTDLRINELKSKGIEMTYAFKVQLKRVLKDEILIDQKNDRDRHKERLELLARSQNPIKRKGL